MDLPPLVLDRASAVPLAVQLADALRGATADGTLRAGDRLPSTRELAVALGVSRTVTAAAYDQLLAEGWVEGRRGAGTFVLHTPLGVTVPTRTGDCSSGPLIRGSSQQRSAAAAGLEQRTAAADPPTAPARVRYPEPERPDRVRALALDLGAGFPCVEALDPAAWKRAWRAAAEAPPDLSADPVGLPEFRAAVVEHLLRHRGLPVDPGLVLATSGSTSAIAELARVLPAGARVAVEEPGYGRAVSALRAAGLRVVPVPVDDVGLDVDAVPVDVAAVYCTPAHQYPLGARLSAARRVDLVEAARRHGFLVIEDDYDGELRYDVAPLPLLAALGPDVVVHLGTASKLLTPTVGTGWMVAPDDVRAAVVAARAATGTRPALAGQRVVAALAAHGDLSRHLRRLRRELAGRRAAVVEAMAGAGLAVLGDVAGAHVVVPLASGRAEERAIDAAAGIGVALDGLARHHLGPPRTAGIVLGYAGPSRAELDHAIPLVARLLAGQDRQP